jgi:sulfate permease, SulP family
MDSTREVSSRFTPICRLLVRFLPALNWLGHYERRFLAGDALAGVIVATLLIPQAMAYALLAGLPPQFGIYASMLPLAVYALLGSSQYLSVGPSALLSLLILNQVSALAEPGSPLYLALAITTAIMVGITQIVMAIVRLGVFTNFLSHPVLSGFTSAAACLIALGQVKHFMGVKLPPTEHLHQHLAELTYALPQSNIKTLAIGTSSVLLLLVFQYPLPPLLERWKALPTKLAQSLSKSGPIVAVVVGTVIVAAFMADEQSGVSVIGEIPRGLPSFTIPTIAVSEWRPLIPLALTVSFIGFLENISVAKSLAARRRQKVDSNQELLALGAANLAAGFTGGYPVSGSFARSTVNFNSGAKTGLASLITVAIVALAAIFLMPLFHYLPQTVLAAIIIVAVAGLIDFGMPLRLWRYNKADAAALILTFLSVLAFGVAYGILIGVASTILLYLWRTSQPHIAIVGRVPQTEHFRNIDRYEVDVLPHTLLLRLDESLYFANVKYIEDYILCTVSEQLELRNFVLICTAINFVDASALETLTNLRDELQEAGVELYLSEVKGPVIDQLIGTEFLKQLGKDHIFLSTQEAFEKLRNVPNQD